METLKKILTVMVITLVLIIVAGGLYVFSMGGMDHGKMKQNPTSTSNRHQNQNETEQEPGNTTSQDTVSQNQRKDSQDQQKDSQNQKSQDQQQNPAGQQPNVQGISPGGPPVIVQVPPQPAKTDPRLYIEQLKERLKSINETNSLIASNSGNQQTITQPDGSVVISGHAGMNELHQGFYKLGQNVSSMEQIIDNLSSGLANVNSSSLNYYTAPPVTQSPVQPQIPYYPYNPYQPYQTPYQQGQTQPNQQGQTQPNQQGQTQPNQHQAHSGQSTSSSGAGNQNILNRLLPNANMLNLAFTFILIISIILGIIAVVGFISSLFKNNKISESSAGS